MKVAYSIGDIKAPEVGKPLVERLCRICPEGGDGKYSFWAVLVENDPRLVSIFRELDAAGLRAEPTGKWKKYIPGREYSLAKTVQYESSDYDASRYCSVKPRFFPRYEEQNTDDANPPIRLLSLEQSLKGLLFASTNFDHLLLTAKGRLAVEQVGFSDAALVPAFLVDPDMHDIKALRAEIAAGETPRLGEPQLWEVRPTVVLPPMLPLKYKHHVNGEDRVSCNPIDVDRRMAYATVDLDRVGQFDFAKPDLLEDPTKSLVDPYVVSQRVFQLMKKQKNFDINHWTPVREA